MRGMGATTGKEEDLPKLLPLGVEFVISGVQGRVDGKDPKDPKDPKP